MEGRLIKKILERAITIREPYPLDKDGNHHIVYTLQITGEELEKMGVRLDSKLLTPRYESPFAGDGKTFAE